MAKDQHTFLLVSEVTETHASKITGNNSFDTNCCSCVHQSALQFKGVRCGVQSNDQSILASESALEESVVAQVSAHDFDRSMALLRNFGRRVRTD